MLSASDKEDEHFELSTQPTVEEDATQVGRLSDDERLRMLGYDAVLGRPLDFWASAGMSICYTPMLFDATVYMSIYAYRGPLLFVSRTWSCLPDACDSRRLSGTRSSRCSTSL